MPHMSLICHKKDIIYLQIQTRFEYNKFIGSTVNFEYYGKNQTKTTVVFKSVKPGVYYLAGRAYVKGYAKSYTKWSKIKKIVVK